MQLRTQFPQIGFGTSGVRALVEDLTPDVVHGYTRAFIRLLAESGRIKQKRCVVGWDLRPSSPILAANVCAALVHEGLTVDLAGQVPTPALALSAQSRGLPGIMVTGSHIPFDRNGIKFYSPAGEILKAEEDAISGQFVGDLALPRPDAAPPGIWIDAAREAGARMTPAALAYLDRYLNLLEPQALRGMRVGVYQHSAVGRDLLTQILERLGCETFPVARSDLFVPIDTEAVSIDDESRAAQWCAQLQLDAVVSTDGDGDRPWVCDERGKFIRGDVLGILTARWLGAQTVVTPVSSNTALEKTGFFGRCIRTRIGSPYVIAAMQQAELEGATAIAGFEANGGFLLQSMLRGLSPLPTRDSALPIIATLALAGERKMALSFLPGLLPSRYTQSDRVKDIASSRSRQLLNDLQEDRQAMSAFLAFTGSEPLRIDTTDGLRIELKSQDILHLRPSGNAPELRCYVEAGSADRANELLGQALHQLNRLASRGPTSQ